MKIYTAATLIQKTSPDHRCGRGGFRGAVNSGASACPLRSVAFAVSLTLLRHRREGAACRPDPFRPRRKVAARQYGNASGSTCRRHPVSPAMRCAADGSAGQFPLLSRRKSSQTLDAGRRSPSRHQTAENQNRQARRLQAGHFLLPSAVGARGRRQPATLWGQHDARSRQAGRRRRSLDAAAARCPHRTRRPSNTTLGRSLESRPGSQKPPFSSSTSWKPTRSPRIAKPRSSGKTPFGSAGRIFELEESLATQAALKAAAISPDAKTFALLIGISKYQKLPQDLWLQFADADAKTFSQHLASARGGGVPPEHMVPSPMKQATTAAVRNAFQTFCAIAPARRIRSSSWSRATARSTPKAPTS